MLRIATAAKKKESILTALANDVKELEAEIAKLTKSKGKPGAPCNMPPATQLTRVIENEEQEENDRLLDVGSVLLRSMWRTSPQSMRTPRR